MNRDPLDQIWEGQRNLLSITAHVLRSPLERLSISLAKLRKMCANDAAVALEIQNAFESLNLANVRISTMLYSRDGAVGAAVLRKSRVQVGKLIGACIERFTQRSISIRFLEDVYLLPPINADAEKLDVVFHNLFENAVKYSWRNQEILVSAIAMGNSVRVSISNRGLGIPESMCEKIFDGRTSTSAQRSGVGLGLYVSRLIVEAHGGTIRARSNPFLDDPERRAAYEGYETTLEVTLPVGSVEDLEAEGLS